MSRVETVKKLYQAQYGQAPEVCCHAPGRVNLIGDHTDYNDGFVLPAAINFGTDIAASKRDDQTVRVYAHDCDQETTTFSLDDIQFDNEKMWSNYVRGSIQVLMQSYPDIKGMDMVVSGNVPQGSGLSSSASFEVAVIKTLAELNNLDLDGIKAALIGQQAENEFVGCNCGIMDQLISAMGKKDHAMLLDCRSLTFKDALIPDNLSLVIVNSNVKRGLVDGDYNKRREQCEQVAQFFNQPALRDVTIEQLEANQDQLDPVLYKRARHVITENTRTTEALSALQNNDAKKISTLMKESHISLRDDFEVTTKEMDGLVEIIDAVLGEAGGVRMTGGGFGGCVIALTPNDLVDKVCQQVEKDYPQQYALNPSIYVCSAADGAFRYFNT